MTQSRLRADSAQSRHFPCLVYTSNSTAMLQTLIALIAPALLLLSFEASSASAQDCNTVAAACTQNPSCNASLTAYLVACNRVLSSGSAADCTPDCLVKLNASNQAEPGFVTCTCSDAQCTTFQGNIKKGCFGIAPTGAPKPFAPSCTALGAACSGANCGPVVTKYLSDCDDLFKGQPCTAKCSASIAALFTINPAFKNCSCGDDPSCLANVDRIHKCVGNNTGPPGPVYCDVAGANCYANPSCSPTLINYLTNCAGLFTGQPYGCSLGCVSSYNAYIKNDPASVNCSCGKDSSCIAAQGPVTKCIMSGPVTPPPPQTCADAIMGCGNNATCGSIVLSYLSACNKVFYSGAACTNDCKNRLDEAIDALPALKECICAGNATCIEAQTNIQKACFGLTPAPRPTCDSITLPCSQKPQCYSILQDYINSCDRVFRSGNVNDCTQSCLDNLKSLTLMMPTYEKCTCSQGDATCSMYQKNIQKGCFGVDMTMPSPTTARPTSQRPTPQRSTPSSKAAKVTAVALVSFFVAVFCFLF